MRHRGLTLKKFVHAIPWDLFERYFARLKPGDRPNPWSFLNPTVLEEFLDDPDNAEASGVIVEDFQRINDLCGSFSDLLVLAYEQSPLDYDQDKPPQEMAMRLFLDEPNAFDYAWCKYLYLASPTRLCEYRLPAGRLIATDEQIESLRTFLRGWFSSLKKGGQCEIARYRESDGLLIRISRGSLIKTIARWREDKIEIETFRPASEDILTYQPADSRLSIKASVKKEREEYVRGFATFIAGNEALAERALSERVFSLDPIRDDTFDYAGGGAINRITLTEARIQLSTLTEPTITVRSENVRRSLGEEIEGLSLDSGKLLRVKLQFEMRLAGDKRTHVANVDIEPPGYSDLAQKAHRDLISAYLKAQGVKLI